MKRFKILSSAVLAMIILVSCGGDKKDYEISELNLKLNKHTILDDNTHGAIVTVTDQKGKEVTTDVDIFAGDNLIQGYMIQHNEPGNLVVHAEYNGIVSNSDNLMVVEDIGLKYDRQVLLEQFTATGCGWCPRAISAIRDVLIIGEDVVHIAYHLNDEFSYIYNADLAQNFGVSGIPAVIAGRETTWDLNNSQLQNLYEEVRTGLSVAYTGEAGGIEVIVDLRFGQVYAESLNFTVYLIEDHLIGDQTNYYNDDDNSPWYQLGAVVSGYSHDNVMRQTLTDMYGNLIPSDSIDIGSEYRWVFETDDLNISNIEHSSVVAFVSYNSGVHRDVVINSIVCDYGEMIESPVIDGK